MKYAESKIKYQFHPPEIPRNRWCDFRRDFESGMTLKSIGMKYHCDQRTVRSCIILNKSSTELGRQYAPTKLEPYIPEIERLYQMLSWGGFPPSSVSAELSSPQSIQSSSPQFLAKGVQIQQSDSTQESSKHSSHQSTPSHSSTVPGITKLSRLIRQEITAQGYTGSERLIQNYLRAKYTLRKD